MKKWLNIFLGVLLLIVNTEAFTVKKSKKPELKLAKLEAQQSYTSKSTYKFTRYTGLDGKMGGNLNIKPLTSTTALKVNPIKLTTSSGSLAPSRTYTIYNRFGELHKFGVTDANLVRYGQSLKSAGPRAYGKFSSIMYKGKAHIMEKFLRSLHFNSTGQYSLPGMKIPYPVNFNTGLPIKP